MVNPYEQNVERMPETCLHPGTKPSRTISKQPKLIFNATDEAMKRTVAAAKRSIHSGYNPVLGEQLFVSPRIESHIFRDPGSVAIPSPVDVISDDLLASQIDFSLTEEEEKGESQEARNSEPPVVLFHCNEMIELKATDMSKDMLNFVLNLCSVVIQKHLDDGKLKCSQMIKKVLTDSLGGLWFVVIGDDYSTSFYGTEFVCGSFVMFYIEKTGFLAFREPLCCKSGVLTLDACGQCLTCAKDVDESCGGPFRTGGTCSSGLFCLRTCPEQSPGVCTAQSSSGVLPCIFPFTYQGRTYTSCTTEKSENGQPWCALQVDVNGVVVTNQWGDCNSDCFESNCNLDNHNGRCVSAARQRSPPSVPHKIDPGTSDPVFVLPCGPGDQKRCVCSVRRTTGASDGEGCDPSGDFPWCFLENVQDPKNPTKDCFQDAYFSTRWGRFVSNDACTDKWARSPRPPGPPGPVGPPGIQLDDSPPVRGITFD